MGNKANIYWEVLSTRVALMVKNLPTNAGDMAWGDPLEKEMATHTSSLAFEISWTEECDRLSL